MYPRGAIPLVFSQRQTLPLSLPCANLFSPSCHDTGSLAIRDRDNVRVQPQLAQRGAERGVGPERGAERAQGPCAIVYSDLFIAVVGLHVAIAELCIELSVVESELQRVEMRRAREHGKKLGSREWTVDEEGIEPRREGRKESSEEVGLPCECRGLAGGFTKDIK